MKILQIYELAPLEKSGTGGIEVAILETSKELVKLGHEVTILTGASNAPEENIVDGVKIINIDFLGLMEHTWDGTNLSFTRQALFPLAVLFNKIGKFDIYHGHIYSSGMVANYLARKNGKVAVNTIHGSYYPVWNELKGPVLAYMYRKAERTLAPMLARISDIQIHTGDYFAKQVLEWNVPPCKVKTILNGVDINRFSPPSEAKQSVHQTDENKRKNTVPTIITARRLVKKNGIDHLIRAFSLVLKKEDCRLLIIGDGSERQTLEELASELKIKDKVYFLGFMPHDRIPELLINADIAVVPSLIEASSLFMLEAMAMAKPVIATNSGGLPEVLDSSTGVLVEAMNEEELADNIIDLLQNPEKRTLLGNNARIHVERNFSWKSVALKLEKEYAELLARK